MRLPKCQVCGDSDVLSNDLGVVYTDVFAVGFSPLVCGRCAEFLFAFFEKITDTLYVVKDETFEDNLEFVERGMKRNGEESPLIHPASQSVDKLLSEVFGDYRGKGKDAGNSKASEGGQEDKEDK